MDVIEIASRSVGAEMMVAAIIGLCLNISTLHRFVHLEKSSFNVLCTSKTVSNSMSLLVYLCYVGPTHLLYTTIGSVTVSSYMNQILGVGLMTQGPLTQMLITVNRFLVVWCTPTGSSNQGYRVTVVALTATWIFTFYLSTLIGLPADCLNPFSFDATENTYTVCNMRITWFMIYSLFLLTVFNNVLNLVIAGKLVWSLKFQKHIKSEVTRRRRNNTIRFFFQSCLQDWLFVLDVANNLTAGGVCHQQKCTILWTMAFDVMIYGVDGLIMYLFNNKRKKRKSLDRVTSMANRALSVTRVS